MGDEDKLQELEAKLRKLDAVGTAIAVEALPGVLEAARATAAAGTDPSGAAWPKTKDGRDALPRAAGAVRAMVSGSTKALITLIVGGVYVFHQRSKSKGKKGLPRRAILPDLEDGLPPAITKAIGDATSRVVGRALGGRQ